MNQADNQSCRYNTIPEFHPDRIFSRCHQVVWDEPEATILEGSSKRVAFSLATKPLGDVTLSVTCDAAVVIVATPNMTLPAASWSTGGSFDFLSIANSSKSCEKERNLTRRGCIQNHYHPHLDALNGWICISGSTQLQVGWGKSSGQAAKL